MANDEAGTDGPIRDVPGRRRATYTPPVRRTPTQPWTDAPAAASRDAPVESAPDVPAEPAADAPAEPAPDAPAEPAPDATVTTHGDDELARALEQEVSRIIPPAPANGSHAGSLPAAIPGLSDDDLVRMIDEDLASSTGTLGAIQKLEGLLAARTHPLPVIPPAEQTAAPILPPTQAGGNEPPVNPFADLATGLEETTGLDPEPTFSNWIAPAAFLADPAMEAGALGSHGASHRSDSAFDVTPTAPHAAHSAGAGSATDAPETAVEPDDTAVEPDDTTAQPDVLSPAAAMVSMPVASSPIPVMQSVATGSHAVLAGAIEDDVADDADDVPIPFEAILAPVASPRVGADEEVLFDAKPIRRPVFSIEAPALEPTPLDYRVGRASRMFWLWFATTSSVITVAIGASLVALGLSVAQLIVATALGIALSFLPLGLGTLAGKWSGQPTMVVSRATFGVVGNVIPAILAVITRLFWGAVLLWIVGTATVAVAGQAGWPGSRSLYFWIAVAAGIVIATTVAVFGYSFVARVQLILTIASALVVLGVGVYTWHSIDLTAAIAHPNSNWLHVAAGAVIVFSFLGLAWANSSGDLARYQRPGSNGTASMLWATFGAALPAFLLVIYGGLLAASDTTIATRLATNPVAALVDAGLPSWYPAPLLAAIVIGLLSSIVVNIYSGGFALQAVGVRLPRAFAVGIIAVAIAAGTALLYSSVPDLRSILSDLVTTLAVPVAAWAGIFSAEMMIRNRRFNPESLLRRGGVYADWRWVNIVALVVASVIGFGLLGASTGWLRWEGFLYPLLAGGRSSDLAQADLGVPIALVLGLLAPVIFGIPAIRRQELAKR